MIDVFTPQILTPPHLLRSLNDFHLTDWMLLPHTSGPHGSFVTTKGLARFGLPELRTENVPPDLVEPWGRLLNGLAHRVLDLWLDELPTEALTADIPRPFPSASRTSPQPRAPRIRCAARCPSGSAWTGTPSPPPTTPKPLHRPLRHLPMTLEERRIDTVRFGPRDRPEPEDHPPPEDAVEPPHPETST